MNANAVAHDRFFDVLIIGGRRCQQVWVSRHRLATSEVNTSHHSLDFTFTASNVSHTPTVGIRDKHGKTRNETTRPAGMLTYPVPPLLNPGDVSFV